MPIKDRPASNSVFPVLLLVVAAFGLPVGTRGVSGDEHWDFQFGPPGTDADVYTVSTNGSDVYVGGNFRTVGGVIVNGVARFDGLRWSALGSGLGATDIAWAMAYRGSDVYVGGSMISAGGLSVTNVARWDGTNWFSLGSGLHGNVFTLTFFGGVLYAGGDFTNAGAVAINHLARWDGTNWLPLGSGVVGASNVLVKVLRTDGTNLYVGGTFTNAGGVAAINLAKWDGTNWSGFNGGIGDTTGGVGDILLDGSNIYVGGQFVTAGNVAVTNIAKWDGSNWSALGGGVSGGFGVIYTIARIGNELLIGGGFTNASGVSAQNIAGWNGNSWTNLSAGITSETQPCYVLSLAVGSGGQIYVGGIFDQAGALPAGGLAIWNGSSWATVGDGFDEGAFGPSPVLNSVRALAVNGADLYAGGFFRSVGRVEANYIARWDGTNWSPLGSGVRGSNDFSTTVVSAIAVSGSNVYVGGNFTNAGGVSANNVAKWDGSGWSALGSGLNGPASAIALSGSDVYVGGSFTSAGGGSANHIAKWDGSSWSALGSGLNSNVTAIAITPGVSFVGGNFTIAGGVNANHIAQWNGTTWGPLDSTSSNGVNGTVNSIIPITPTALYIGGTFTTAGGTSVNRLAQGYSSWSGLGSGVTGGSSPAVLAMAYDGANLYVVGSFTNAGGLTANGIAKWDGASWSALGGGGLQRSVSGLSPAFVTAVVNAGNDIYAGGRLLVAGDKPSSGIGRYNGQLTFTPPAVTRLDHPMWSAGGPFQCRVTASLGTTYTIEASTNLTSWVPLTTNSSSPFDFFDPDAALFADRFYRARTFP